MNRLHASLTAVVLGGLCAPAWAQVSLTVDPAGQGSAPAEETPAEDERAPAAKPGGQPAPGGEAAAEEGFYYGDSSASGEPREVRVFTGQVPEVHVVRSGDTLWDISGYYYANPWEWPRVWSLNPAIVNPHWIYPGDTVRLIAEGSGRTAPVVEPAPAEVPIEEPRRASAPLVELRQLAFVSLDDMSWAGTVVGATDEKSMLSTGDEIFIEYPEGRPPQVGRRYAIYSPTQEVNDPRDGKKVGAYVTLHGEVEIQQVKKGKTARGVITYATDVIERGRRVGTVKTQFKQVPPVAASRSLETTIVAIIGGHQFLIGAGQMVFLDRGAADGLRPGNRLFVVRRGDAWDAHMGPRSASSRDDARYPEEAVAQVIVVEVGEGVSVALVEHAAKEIEVGDHAVMRKGR